MKILHIVGGLASNGSFQGANILHNALLKKNVDSKILNDSYQKILANDKSVIFLNKGIKKK